MPDFTGKTIVVTGGARGIGRAIVEYLLHRNAQVVIADCDREAGEELAGNLRRPERNCFFPTDVGREESVARCIDLALHRFGCIDGVVNNAGIANPGHTPVTDLGLEAWEDMLRVNLTGPFLMVKHAAPHIALRKGAIVNIASTRALQSEPHTEAYTASKGGLVALTHALAISFSHRLRVNAILPGWIDVSAHRLKGTHGNQHLRDEDHRQHPAGRVGVPDDVAALAAFLLSEKAAFITGQAFVADGGMTKKMMYVE